MTIQEKRSLKSLVKNLTIYVSVIYVLGTLTMIIGTLLILMTTSGNVQGNEIIIFSTGAAIMVIGLLLSVRTNNRYIVPLQSYRNDLFLKKNKLYYDRCCFYAKNNEIDKAIFYHSLIKNNILRDISFGFLLGRMYDSKDTKEYNDFIDKYKSTLN